MIRASRPPPSGLRGHHRLPGWQRSAAGKRCVASTWNTSTIRCPARTGSPTRTRGIRSPSIWRATPRPLTGTPAVSARPTAWGTTPTSPPVPGVPRPAPGCAAQSCPARSCPSRSCGGRRPGGAGRGVRGRGQRAGCQGVPAAEPSGATGTAGTTGRAGSGRPSAAVTAGRRAFRLPVPRSRLARAPGPDGSALLARTLLAGPVGRFRWPVRWPGSGWRLPGGWCRRTRCAPGPRGWAGPSCASLRPRAVRPGRRSAPGART